VKGDTQMIIFQAKAFLSREDLAKNAENIRKQADTGIIVIDNMFEVMATDDEHIVIKTDGETIC
jgi:hypothetical protein